MPDTLTPPSLPRTPAEVAAAVLDRIEQYPEMFDMNNWAVLPTGVLEPGDDIQCGTTMCIAGWAAHLTGYTLHRTPDGLGAYARKDGRRYEVEFAAARVLGVDEVAAAQLFWDPADVALAQLREIAGR
ncbi:hypothetical protein [Streptomyces sp. NPDC094468]|uniref:hypothetical protein n=1 Tax=Streptomyces sp. NPDC094468 TaxID=3366066 RepID=UPI00380ED694